MSCRNCGESPETMATLRECWACYRYRLRTGEVRPPGPIVRRAKPVKTTRKGGGKLRLSLVDPRAPGFWERRAKKESS